MAYVQPFAHTPGECMTTVGESSNTKHPTPAKPADGAAAAGESPSGAIEPKVAGGATPRAGRDQKVGAALGRPSALGLPTGAPGARVAPGSAVPGQPSGGAAQPQGPVGSYADSFGHQSYVKDGSNAAMLGLMSRAVAAHPELARGPLGQGVSQGHVGPQQVKALQSFLQSKGYSVGRKGVDGKFGPDTHAALAGMLNGQPPTSPPSTPGAAPSAGPRPASLQANGTTGARGEVKNGPPVPNATPNASPGNVAPDAHTAVYDVSTGRVYLPDGTKLEAHSGLGANRDNPASMGIRNKGATPAATYKLSMREAAFHGVKALRLTPIAGTGNTHGRDGILAHTYMLRRAGDSNGCVVFKNYPAFLHAYQSGQIKQIKVVAHL